MLFNSIEYILFYPVALAAYYLINKQNRWIVLLIGSYYFYLSWFWAYGLLIASSTLVDYFVARQIYKSKKKTSKKRYLYLSVFMNVGLLATFKYLNFFEYTATRIAQFFDLTYIPFFEKIIVPIGISFYTFQTLSYTIDVYRNKVKPENHIGKFAVFVAFFPQLVAGPIERAQNLIPQLNKPQNIDYETIKSAVILIFWGYFQKMVIADNMSPIVDEVYNNPQNYYGWNIFIATVFFAFQIFGDFAGYTNIARGSALLFGIRLSKNFNHPYFATSLHDFWHKWHITFSEWLREYIYFALGGDRVQYKRWIINILATFLVSGLWHGAKMGFLVWGFVHGIFYIIEHFTKKKLLSKIVFTKIPNSILSILQISITFLIVNFSWVFFRAKSVKHSILLIKHFFISITDFHLIFNREMLLFNFFMIFILYLVYQIEKKTELTAFIASQSKWKRWLLYYFTSLFFLIFANFEIKEFIYFQF